jgi:hypothetical protein
MNYYERASGHPLSSSEPTAEFEGYNIKEYTSLLDQFYREIRGNGINKKVDGRVQINIATCMIKRV